MKTTATGLSLFIFILQHLGQCLAQSWLSIPVCGVEKKKMKYSGCPSSLET